MSRNPHNPKTGRPPSGLPLDPGHPRIQREAGMALRQAKKAVLSLTDHRPIPSEYGRLGQEAIRRLDEADLSPDTLDALKKAVAHVFLTAQTNKWSVYALRDEIRARFNQMKRSG